MTHSSLPRTSLHVPPSSAGHLPVGRGVSLVGLANRFLLAAGVAACAAPPDAAAQIAHERLPSPDRPLDASVETLYEIGGPDATDADAFGRVLDLAFDGRGRLYVLDDLNHRIVVVEPDGAGIHSFGRKGRGPGELVSPSSLALSPEGHILVMDQGARRVLVLGERGEALDQHELPIHLGFPRNGELAAGSGGRLVFRNMLHFDAARPGAPSEPLVEWTPGSAPSVLFPYHPAASSMPGVRATGPGRITLDPARLMSEAPPAFLPRLSWALLPGGRIAVHDTEAYRVKTLDPSGAVSMVLERDIPPTPPTRAERRSERARQRAELENGGGPRLAAGAPAGGPSEEEIERRLASLTFHEPVPVLDGIEVDDRGRLWLRRIGRPVGSPSPLDVVEPDGEGGFAYLGTLRDVPLPDAFGPGGLIAWRSKDAFDVPVIRVARIRLGSPGSRTDGR